MQRRMLRMTALIQHRRLRLLAGMNRHQYRSLRMMFPKVIAKSTLPDVKCLHTTLLCLYHLEHRQQNFVASRAVTLFSCTLNW